MEGNIIRKKEYIVIAAIALIDEKGIYNVSTKEIAKRVGISEGMIFKIFPKKSDLMLTVLDNFSMYDNDMYRTTFERYEDPFEAILFYITKYLVYYENYPEITAVFQGMELLYGLPGIEDRAKEIYQNRLNALKQLVIKAQDMGKMDRSIDPDTIAVILYSIFRGMCVKWRTAEYGFPLTERTKYAISIVLDSLKKQLPAV